MDHAVYKPQLNSPFLRHIGMQFGDYGDGWAEVLFPVRPEFLNGAGTVSGGTYASVIDCAMVCALYTRLPRTRGMATMDLNVRYLRATSGGTLRGIGRILDLGKKVAQAEAEISIDGILLAKGGGSFRLLSPRDGAAPVHEAEAR